MSTISITTARDFSAPALPALRPATRLRLTARGRRVIAALIALPIAAMIALAGFNAASAIASSETATSVSFETVTVLPGDSLWSIAGEIAPASDPRDVVDAIIRLNLLGDGTIFAGQELAIPLKYASGR